jgi:predicted Fe-Mo cluster-binding NifX family protein
MASTAVVLVGLIGSALGLRFVDRVAAFVVVVFVARTGWRILVDAMRSLLDASVDHTTLDNIRSVVLADSRIMAIRSIVARNSGSVIFISLDLICMLQSLDDVNDASKELAAAVKATIPHVEGVQITMEPAQRDYLLVAVPLADNEGTLSEHFGKAPCLAIVKIKRDGREVVEREFLPNPFINDEKAKGIRLARYLLEKGVDILYSRESLAGKGPAYVLEAAGMHLRTTDSESLDDLIARLVAEER